MADEHFGPLPDGYGKEPMKGATFLDVEVHGSISAGGTITGGTIVGGTITGGSITGTTITGGTISGTVVTGSDFYSTNWNGTIPLSLASKDAGASAGFALDGSTGGAQFQKIFAEGGSLGALTVDDTITLGTGGTLDITGTGVIRSATSGNRYEMAATATYASLDLFSGHADETANGEVRVTTGAAPAMWILAPKVSSFDAPMILDADGSITLEKQSSGTIWPQVIVDDTTSIKANDQIDLWVEDSGSQVALHNNGDATTVDGTAAAPILSFWNDLDTGVYRPGTNQIALAAGGVKRLTVLEGSASGRTRLNLNGATPGTDAVELYVGDTRRQLWNPSTGEHVFYAKTGTTNLTLADGANNGIFVQNVGFAVGIAPTTLTSGYIYNAPPTTGAAANATWVVASGSTYYLNRSTSARKYKSKIDYDMDRLADYELRPTKFYRDDDERWFLGFIADDLAGQDKLLGVYEDGEIENFDNRALLAVMAAKINRLEEKLNDLTL